MSALPISAVPVRRARQRDLQREPQRAPLAAVVARPQRRTRPRAAHAIVTVVGVFAILLAQLALSIALSEGAYRVSALETERVELDRTTQVLSESLDTLRSPQNLAMNAEALGMVANSNPAYLRLSDGIVIGAPVPAASGTGVLDGSSSMIGNVLLTEAATVTAPDATAPSLAGVAAGSSAPTAIPSAPGAIPAPSSR